VTNLDLVKGVKEKYPTIPLAAYQVSGEYAMIKLLSEHVDENTLILETLNSIKRAGADMILTYYAKEVAKLLSKQK
jgi:porphobilinogen synthase